MNCPKCYSLLPDDSSFCQYCGSKITHDVKVGSNNQIETESNNASESSMNTTSTRASIGEFAVTYSSNIGALSNHKSSKKPKKTCRLWVLIIVVILLIVSVAANMYQIYKSNVHTTSLEGKISALEKENLILLTEKTKLEQENKGREEIITSQRKKITSLQTENSNSSEIYSALKMFNYGSLFSDYFTNSEIVVVRVGETKTLRITYNVTAKSSISFQANNSKSIGKWNDWDSNDSCSVNVTGSFPGTTIYTFTNDYNNHAFKVLVIVLPKD